jgi:CubicO group peptidase (beta-lactamase class C family)
MHPGKIAVAMPGTIWPPLSVILMGMLLLLAVGCQTFSSRAVTDPSAAVARLEAGGSIAEEVDRLAQPLIDAREIFGVAVGVLTPEAKISVFGYGSTGKDRQSPSPDGDTIFQIGSVSKVFLTALLAVLVDEGVFSYEDTVREIMPPEVPLSEAVGQLTLHELATNTGGFPRQPFCPKQLWDAAAFIFTGRNVYAYIDKPYLYTYIRGKQLRPKESREYVYSNIGFGLLAHLIEVRTGQRFEELLEKKICAPLNLRDTTFSLSEEQKTRLATGHVGGQPRFMRRGQPMQPWDMGEIMRPSGCLYSTANDLMIFAKANLGMLSNPLEPVLASTKLVQCRRPDEDVALGWLINYLGADRLEVIYKHGMVAGYSAYIGMEPASGIVVVALYNTFSWDDKLGHNLLLRLSRAQKPVARAVNPAELSP